MRIPLTCLVLLLLAQTAQGDTRFAGYIKTFALARQAIDSPYLQSPRLYQSQSSLRLMWQVFAGHSAWQLHYELTPVISSHVPAYDSAAIANANAWRMTDIEKNLSHNPRRRLLQNLDRLNVQFSFNAGDLTIGRQPITFGVARVINPTDVFLPYDVRTLNQEYRIGVDAIRFRHPLGPLGEVDVGLVAGKHARASDSAAFLQLRSNVSGKDLQFAFIRFAGQTLVGGGVQTAIGACGFWLEAANVTGDEHYVRVSTGIDYAFSENIYGLIEYHFNGAGTGNRADYLHQLTTKPYRVGGVFLLGRQYLIPSLRWQVTPLWTLKLEAIDDLTDGSAFISTAATWNASENAYIDLGYYHFLGSRLSEYGSDPDTFYASVRYYF